LKCILLFPVPFITKNLQREHSFEAMDCELALEADESAAGGRSQAVQRSPGAGLL
jgi:hypothetical protein